MNKGKLSAVCGEYVYSTSAVVINNISLSDLAGNEHHRQWSGVVDTGAGRSVVPLTVCEELGLSPCDKRRPIGFDSQVPRREVPLYYVKLYVGIARSNLLLGRDFLHGLVLLMDNDRSHYQLGRHSHWSRLICGLLRLR
jgi:predicted aspartyl protease